MMYRQHLINHWPTYVRYLANGESNREAFKAQLKEGEYHFFTSNSESTMDGFLRDVGLTDKVVFRSKKAHNTHHYERSSPQIFLVICKS